MQEAAGHDLGTGTGAWGELVSGHQLPEPSRLIKVFVSRSRCFTLVDRGAGMAAAQNERALAADGNLRRGSNVGKGQVKAADYVLVPDLISQNSDAGGNAVGGLLSGLVGGRAGQVLGGLNFKKKTADVVLTVTDVRSSEQVALAEGSAKKTDIASARAATCSRAPAWARPASAATPTPRSARSSPWPTCRPTPTWSPSLAACRRTPRRPARSRPCA